MFGKVAIIGAGLIGGSMGMALRRQEMADRVIGIGRRQESLDAAVRVGAIDEGTLDAREGVGGADLVVLATPIGMLGELTARIADALSSDAILTDVASTKTEVIDAICGALKGRPDVAYVPTHPMAGSEQRGPEAASADLFRDAVCIITPLVDTLPEAKSRVSLMWRALGAQVVSMTPQAHDRAVAHISHLPHLVASTLMTVQEQANARLCGRGLLDTTRVASGSPAIWTDICLTNRSAIRDAIDDFIAALRKMREAVSDRDAERISAMLSEAKEKRDRLVESRRSRPTAE